MNVHNIFQMLVKYFVFSNFLQAMSAEKNTSRSLSSSSHNHIRRRLSGPQGTEFQINTYSSLDQDNPKISALNDGGFIAVWSSSGQDGSGDEIYGKRYLATGIAIGSEFRINTYTTSSQTKPAVATLSDGSFVVTWVSSNQDGSGTGIYAQRYTANSIANGGEFRVNTYTLYSQTYPTITALNDGGFVIAWSSNSQDGSDDGIYAQRYTTQGVASGGEFRANTYTLNSQTTPAIAALTDGGFVITWASYGQDGSYDGVYGQCYTASGNANGGEFRANTYTTNSQTASAIAGLNDGGFVITWSSYGQSGLADGVYGQRYTANRVQTGTEFRVNTHVGNSQDYSKVAALVNGGFIVIWASYGDGYYYGVYGQYYGASGSPSYGEFQINTYVFDNQWNPTIAILADGGFVVAWASYGQDISTYASYGIYGQRFDASGNKIAVQTTAKPTLSPSLQPTLLATRFPSYAPTTVPSTFPSFTPTPLPSTTQPVVEATYQPSVIPSVLPSYTPTAYPSIHPTDVPTTHPSEHPSQAPTTFPSVLPTFSPTVKSTIASTLRPSSLSTTVAAIIPTITPSIFSTETTTFSPTNIPSLFPSTLPPSLTPSLQPTTHSSQIPQWLIFVIIISGIISIGCLVSLLIFFRLRKDIASRLNAYFMLSTDTTNLSQVFPEPEAISVENVSISEAPRAITALELNSAVSHSIYLISLNELEVENEGIYERRGGFAKVNKARWRNEQIVAVKQSLFLERQDAIRHEIQVLSRLNHPHIVAFFGYTLFPGTHEYYPVIVMEYCPGGTLREYLQRFLNSSSPIPWQLHFRMAYELAQALAYLHEKGIIHRDIKSPNVLLDAQQHIKLCDFGIAHEREDGLLDTQTHGPLNNVAGTYNWMPPEFFRPLVVTISRQSDIWSLGMVYFELVSLTIPFHDALNRDQVTERILTGEGENVPNNCATQYPAFAQIMSDCWKERGQRPRAAQLVERIAALPRMAS